MSGMKRKFRGDGFAAAEALYGRPRKDPNGQFNLDLSGESIHNDMDLEPPDPIFGEQERNPIYSPVRTSLDIPKDTQ